MMINFTKGFIINYYFGFKLISDEFYNNLAMYLVLSISCSRYFLGLKTIKYIMNIYLIRLILMLSKGIREQGTIRRLIPLVLFNNEIYLYKRIL
jgi:hypothetical protein